MKADINIIFCKGMGGLRNSYLLRIEAKQKVNVLPLTAKEAKTLSKFYGIKLPKASQYDEVNHG